MKTKGASYPVSEIRWLQFFLHHRVTAMVIHWAFQSIMQMDVTEKAFKLTIDLFFTILFSVLLITWMPIFAAIMSAFLFAHTINFLLNGQIYVVLKNFGDIEHELTEYDEYIEEMKIRLQTEPSIRWAAIYGSMARNELKKTSDLDIRFIRKPGFLNGLRSCMFVLLERTRANLNRFPIDFLIFDIPHPLKKMRSDESPVILCQR